jgi:hypothetical protein
MMMAKKKAASNGTSSTPQASGNGTSKSALVRDYIEKNPTAGNKEIEQALTHLGVKYTDVTNAKASLAKKGLLAGRKRRRRRRRQQAAITAPTPTAQASPASRAVAGDAERLGKAAMFAKECGSLDKAITLLQDLKRLLK